MLRPSLDTYADGVVAIMASTPSRPVVGVDPSGIVGLDRLRTMAYCQMSRQEADVKLADDEGFELSAKLKVRHVGDVTPDNLALIGTRLCEIGHVDDDRVHDYLYLSEIKTDGTLQLLSKTTVLDSHHVATSTWDGPTVYVRKATKSLLARFEAMSQSLNPTATFVIRACDYSAQPKVRRDGVTYDVSGTTSDGRWMRLTCERGATT